MKKDFSSEANNLSCGGTYFFHLREAGKDFKIFKFPFTRVKKPLEAA